VVTGYPVTGITAAVGVGGGAGSGVGMVIGVGGKVKPVVLVVDGAVDGVDVLEDVVVDDGAVHVTTAVAAGLPGATGVVLATKVCDSAVSSV